MHKNRGFEVQEILFLFLFILMIWLLEVSAAFTLSTGNLDFGVSVNKKSSVLL